MYFIVRREYALSSVMNSFFSGLKLFIIQKRFTSGITMKKDENCKRSTFSRMRVHLCVLKTCQINLVVPPLSRLMSIKGLFVCQEPPVKSGTSIDPERLATDHSLSGITELQDAAS